MGPWEGTKGLALWDSWPTVLRGRPRLCSKQSWFIFSSVHQHIDIFINFYFTFFNQQNYPNTTGMGKEKRQTLSQTHKCRQGQWHWERKIQWGGWGGWLKALRIRWEKQKTKKTSLQKVKSHSYWNQEQGWRLHWNTGLRFHPSVAHPPTCPPFLRTCKQTTISVVFSPKYWWAVFQNIQLQPYKIWSLF